MNFAVRLVAHDLAGRERLAQCMLRCPFSLDRMIRVTDEGKVLYLAEKKTTRRFPKPASPDLLGHVRLYPILYQIESEIRALPIAMPTPRLDLRAGVVVALLVWAALRRTAGASALQAAPSSRPPA